MKQFTTHTGQTVSGAQLQAALDSVASDLRESGKRALAANDWPAHVTQAAKESYVQRFFFDIADQVQRGEDTTLGTLQRLNTVLTGECVGLLP